MPMGPKIHIKQTCKLALIGLTFALTVLAFFAPVAAQAAPYLPGDTNFPYNPGATPVPNDEFSYAHEGLESGLNDAKNSLPGGIQKEDSFTKLVIAWINYFLQFYIFVAVGIIIYFGIQILISREKTDKRKEAITAIINIAIGTILIFFAYAIVIAIVNLVSVEEFKSNTGAVAQTASTGSTDPTHGSAPTPAAANGISSATGVFYAPDTANLKWTIAIPTGWTVDSYTLTVTDVATGNNVTLDDAALRGQFGYISDYTATNIIMSMSDTNVRPDGQRRFPFSFRQGGNYTFQVKARMYHPSEVDAMTGNAYDDYNSGVVSIQ